MISRKAGELESFGIDIQSFILMKHGLKPVIRICTDERDTKHLKGLSKTMGFEFVTKRFTTIYREKIKPTTFVYISSSKNDAKRALKSEEIGNKRELGKMLGYPECCVEFFVKNETKVDFTFASLFNTKKYPRFYCNNLFVFDSKLPKKEREVYHKKYDIFRNIENLFLIKHVPCSFDCNESVKIGKETLKILKENETDLAKEIVNALKRKFLYFDYFRWVVFDGQIKRNEISYRKVIPHRSLLDGNIMKKIERGNRIIAKHDKTIIMIDDEKILEVPMKGLLIDFR